MTFSVLSITGIGGITATCFLDTTPRGRIDHSHFGDRSCSPFSPLETRLQSVRWMESGGVKLEPMTRLLEVS